MFSGMLTNVAIAVDDSKVEDTTIGIGRMNFPIIPLASNNGKNDQTTVRVPVQIGMK